jgi:hypothetical protein
VTPGATSVDDEVVPADEVSVGEAVVLSVIEVLEEPDTVDVVDAPVVVLPVTEPVVESDSPAEDVDALLFAAAAVDSAPAALDESAAAMPGEVTTITPIPNAAANAPTRPM